MNGLAARLFERGALFGALPGRQCVAFVQGDDFGLLLKPRAIGFEFTADDAIGLAHILLRAIDEMDEDAAALDMAQKAVAETLALMRALDKAGNIGEHEAASVEGDDAEAGCQGG